MKVTNGKGSNQIAPLSKYHSAVRLILLQDNLPTEHSCLTHISTQK